MPGEVLKEVAPKWYIVEVNGGRYKRIRTHIRDSLIQEERTPTEEEIEELPASKKPDQNATVESRTNSQESSERESNETSDKVTESCVSKNQGTVTRSGRIVRKPARFLEQ